MAVELRTGTMKPVTLSVTASRFPITSVAIIGTPNAIASKEAMGSPSHNDEER